MYLMYYDPHRYRVTLPTKAMAVGIWEASPSIFLTLLGFGPEISWFSYFIDHTLGYFLVYLYF